MFLPLKWPSNLTASLSPVADESGSVLKEPAEPRGPGGSDGPVLCPLPSLDPAEVRRGRVLHVGPMS